MNLSTDGPEHFRDEEWADYVQLVVPEARRKAMVAHLDGGCAACRESVAWLTRVREAATADSRFEVPADLLASARELFVPAAPTGWMERLPALVAELVSSSSLAAQPSGVRSGGVGNRFVYRAGAWTIDLAVDPLTAEGTCEIVGQIQHEGATVSPRAMIVQGLSASQVLGETETNQFGEFVLSVAARRALLLRLASRRESHRVEIPLKLIIEN